MTTFASKFLRALMLTPAVAFVLHDLVFQLPDNQHDASPGFFATAASLGCVWALGGYIAARGTRDVLAAFRAGAGPAAVSVALLWLTFVVLNAAFIDRMSYEPARIRALQASGAPTMRAYVFREQGIVGPFPLLMCAAALVGGAGGMLGRPVR